ncbi:FkbM family methyltransferase [Polynucleobacter paneuropaeus]|jgi:FkbM family methyltransferase|nr:FkbM family methyltransferase [Polynucleobacter paneuropaeus]
MSNKLLILLNKLKSQGIPLNVIYDIGARHAEWSKSLFESFPKSDFFLFEANPHSTSMLDKSGFHYIIEVLSSSPMLVDFYDSNSSGDSIYKEISAHCDDVIPTKRLSTTLDIMVEDHNLPLPDLIKLDTQGSELDILEGFTKNLNYVSLLYLE